MNVSESRQDTERTAVRTYVPAYQKAEWKRQADELGMSLSEFVRTMVQAGRADFEVPDPSEAGSDDSPGADPGGNDLEDRILDVLEPDRYLGWDELVDRVVGDVEERTEEALERLQRENRVTYSGRNGGYTLIDDGDD